MANIRCPICGLDISGSDPIKRGRHYRIFYFCYFCGKIWNKKVRLIPNKNSLGKKKYPHIKWGKNKVSISNPKRKKRNK